MFLIFFRALSFDVSEVHFKMIKIYFKTQRWLEKLLSIAQKTWGGFWDQSRLSWSRTITSQSLFQSEPLILLTIVYSSYKQKPCSRSVDLTLKSKIGVSGLKSEDLTLRNSRASACDLTSAETQYTTSRFCRKSNNRRKNVLLPIHS